jgi:chaperone required for assembly of F1-ATPase
MAAEASRKGPKRFYKEAKAASGPGGWRVLLDGRPLRTPLKRELLLPSADLAKAVAEEWSRQAETIDASGMPLTALACTALDRIGQEREGVERELLAYGGNDLLCYWAEAPEALVTRQRERWQPLLDWAEESLGARLVTSAGVMHRPQPEEALRALEATLRGLDDFRLAALSSAVAVSGSLIIGLALAKGRLGAQEAFELAELDSLFQQEFWGRDSEAERRQRQLSKELEAVEEFLSSL